jgi:hypothetical protein
MGDQTVDPLADARYTAEISNRMQVPDRIMVSGESQSGSPATRNGSGSGGGDGGNYNDAGRYRDEEGRYNDLGMRQRDPRLDMQVSVVPGRDDVHMFVVLADFCKNNKDSRN